MVNAQEWLNEKYPTNRRSEITELDISNQDLEGHLDLKDFENLKSLDCSNNKLTGIDLSNCKNLQKISCHNNQLSNTGFLGELPNPKCVNYLNIEFPLTDEESINRTIKTEISWESLKELALLLRKKEISHSTLLTLLRLMLIEIESTLAKTKKIAQLEKKNQKYSIFEASKENDVETIQTLIDDNGIDINSTDEQGNTPLHCSAMKGNLEATQRLLELGAKVDIKNEDDQTPLHIVAGINNEDAVEISIILLERKANPNTKDWRGNTPLHIAALDGNLELLKTLCKYNGNVNATNNFNWSVLHSAASAIVKGIENWEMVTWLIKNGADTTIRTEVGFSAYDILQEKDCSYADYYEQLIIENFKKNASI